MAQTERTCHWLDDNYFFPTQGENPVSTTAMITEEMIFIIFLIFYLHDTGKTFPWLHDS